MGLFSETLGTTADVDRLSGGKANKTLIFAITGLTNMIGAKKKANREKGFGETATAIQAELSKKLDAIGAKLDGNDKEKNLTNSVLDLLLNLDNEKIKLIDDGFKVLDRIADWTNEKGERFASTLNSITDALVNMAKKLTANQSSFESMGEVFSKLALGVDLIKDTGKGLILLAGGLLAIAGAFFLLTSTLGAGGFILLGVGILAIGAALKMLFIMTGVEDGKDSAISKMGIGLGMLALAVIGLAIAGLIFTAVGFKGLAMMGLTLLLLTTVFIISNKMLGGDGSDGDSALATQMVALSIGVIGLAIASYLFSVIGTDGIFTMIGAVLALGFAVAAASRASGGDISKTILALSLGLIVFTLTIWLWNKLVPDNSMAIGPLIALTAMTTALVILGKRSGDVFKGAIALIIAGAAILLLGFALKQWESITLGTIGVMTIG